MADFLPLFQVAISGRSQCKRENKYCTSLTITKACKNPEELGGFMSRRLFDGDRMTLRRPCVPPLAVSVIKLELFLSDSKMECLQLTMTEVLKRLNSKSKMGYNQVRETWLCSAAVVCARGARKQKHFDVCKTLLNSKTSVEDCGRLNCFCFFFVFAAATHFWSQGQQDASQWDGEHDFCRLFGPGWEENIAECHQVNAVSNAAVRHLEKILLLLFNPLKHTLKNLKENVTLSCCEATGIIVSSHKFNSVMPWTLLPLCLPQMRHLCVPQTRQLQWLEVVPDLSADPASQPNLLLPPLPAHSHFQWSPSMKMPSEFRLHFIRGRPTFPACTRCQIHFFPSAVRLLKTWGF